MADYIVTKDGELKHYGVKGMKWGVRKKDSAERIRDALLPVGRAMMRNKKINKAMTDLTKANMKRERRKDAIGKESDRDVRYGMKKTGGTADEVRKGLDAANARIEQERAAKNTARQNKIDSYTSNRTKRAQKALDRQKKAADSWKDVSEIRDKKGRLMLTSEDVQGMRDAAIERVKKLEYKVLVSQKADKINAGASAVGKIYNRLTGADKYQAEIELDMEKRARVNKNWRD